MYYEQGEHMNLTKLERIQLINQFEVLKILKPAEQEYYEELIEILTNGYAIFYSELENWLFDEMPVEEGQFVLDVLDLYRAIENYKFHHEARAIIEHAYGNFKGFDENEEGHHFLFTRFLIDKQNKFQEQKQYEDTTDQFNNHWPSLSKYRRMVAKWEGFDKKHDLNEAEILGILNS
jgi:uncharacterized protein